MSKQQVEQELVKKLVSAEQAARVVKSGDRVVFAPGVEPLSMALALAGRKDELKNVKLYLPGPGRELPYFESGWEDSFSIEISYVLPPVERMMAEKRCDYLVSSLFFTPRTDLRPIDVYIVEVSPPDEKGYCSFGHMLWNKKTELRAAKVVIADINPKFIRTYGDNSVHISEIDYFVEHITTGRIPGSRDRRGQDLLARKTGETFSPEIRKIGENVAELVRDGDTLQIGVGSATEVIVRLGVLEDKRDLGIHTEVLPFGAVDLVRKGVITGKRKTLHPNKVVATTVGGGAVEDMIFIDNNPMFEVYEGYHVTDPRVIASNDNMVAINGCIAVDLTGQIAAESIGTRMYSGTGGQLSFAIGTYLANGGRFITACTSTVAGGRVSKIVPMLEPGTVVSIPRVLAGYVVTEYGIASLRDKTQRERAEELIRVSHPKFRDELRMAAAKLYWP